MGSFVLFAWLFVGLPIAYLVYSHRWRKEHDARLVRAEQELAVLRRQLTGVARDRVARNAPAPPPAREGRGWRAVWLAGGGLLAVVVRKLFFFDLSQLSGLGRVVAFLAVGLMLLALGYFSPRRRRARRSARRPESAGGRRTGCRVPGRRRGPRAYRGRAAGGPRCNSPSWRASAMPGGREISDRGRTPAVGRRGYRRTRAMFQP